LGLVLVVLGIVATAIATYWALRCAERYLADMTNVRNVAVFTFLLYVILSAFPRDPYYEEFHFGGFAKSAVPRLKHEAKFLLNVYGYTAEKVRAIAETKERL